MSKVIRTIRARIMRWRFYRAYPEIKGLVDQINTERRHHRPTRRIVKAQKQAVLNALRGR